jgi:hypothetical protein
MRFSKEMTVAVLSILMSSAAIAHASDTCKNVMFKFTTSTTRWNHRSSPDQILTRPWRLENRRLERRLRSGKDLLTAGDNLKDSEGEELTSFLTSSPRARNQPTIGPTTEGGDGTDDPTCFANSVFKPGKTGFTIFGTD